MMRQSLGFLTRRRRSCSVFSDAAAGTFGSASSSTSKQPRRSANLSGEWRSEERNKNPDQEDGEEVSSPLKKVDQRDDTGKEKMLASNAGRQLFQARKEESQSVPRKRKSKTANPESSQTPDLNLPAKVMMAVVPMGLVSSRTMNQIDGDGHETGTPTTATSDELTKKQKRTNTQPNARSAAAAGSSPRWAQ
jgi:FtsZ-interacting cell division protein ZipA